MICEGVLICNMLIGGVTYHFTDKYAPENGYNWNNQTIGVEIGTKINETKINLHSVIFKDSYFKRSQTHGLAVTEKIFEKTYGGITIDYTKTSYFEHALLAPVISREINVKKKAGEIYLMGLPPMGNNDGFINVGLKVRF